VRKAVVGGAAVAVLAVVGLVLSSDSGLPLIPGRPPTTSNPDPVGLPPEGPTVDLDALSVHLSHLDLEADDGLHGIAEFDRDGGEVRSEPDRSTRDAEGALASVLLGLIVLKASRAQDRDRRVRAAAPASAA